MLLPVGRSISNSAGTNAVINGSRSATLAGWGCGRHLQPEEPSVRTRIQAVRDFLKRSRTVRRILHTRAYHSLRHWLVLRSSERDPQQTFTQFVRLPTQYKALAGPVLDFLLAEDEQRPLTITVIGCANGAEPFSIASVLLWRRPDVEFTVKAYDNNPDMIDRARRAQYTPEQVRAHPRVTDAFVSHTFQLADDGLFRIRKEVAEVVQVSYGDILDPAFVTSAGRSDIVFAQNLLFNYRPKVAKEVFRNIVALLNPRAALFLDGMDLGMRQRLVRRYQLTPLKVWIREIHEEARKIRGDVWSWCYWGLEPFSRSRRGWEQRYATIFLRNEGLSSPSLRPGRNAARRGTSASLAMEAPLSRLGARISALGSII